MKKKSKKWIWLPVLLLLAAGAAAAWFFIPRDSGEPVFVYGFMDGTAGISDYYDGMNQSDGMVSTDRIQVICLSGTQTVKEILVHEGQQVQKGDVLFTYDTTLSDIQLRRKELSVQQLQLDLVTAQQELAVINSYVPISYHPVETPEIQQPEEPEVEISDLELEGLDFLAYSGKGDTSLTPKYCWLRSEAMVDELMMQALFQDHEGDSLFIIFQHTEDDSSEGAITEQFGLKIMRLGSAEEGDISYRFSFYDPAKVGQPEGPIDDGVDWNSGFTAAEIHQMRLAQLERIEDLEFQIKMAEAEYRIMQKEADNGQAVAEFDGIVVGLLDPESALAFGEPLMKVSGGGGYYITGSVSELDLGTIELGQVVDIMSWDTGMSYEGTIVDIQQFPDESGNSYYYYGASQNVSYYPYTVFVDGSAMLQDGYWVSMSLRGAEGAGGLYINNAFLLSEGASNYVYVRGEDGLLEKRKVQVGGLLWGEYSLITEGLTAEDYVAFPYGKDIREGAPTAEGSWEDLMGY